MTSILNGKGSQRLLSRGASYNDTLQRRNRAPEVTRFQSQTYSVHFDSPCRSIALEQPLNRARQLAEHDWLPCQKTRGLFVHPPFHVRLHLFSYYQDDGDARWRISIGSMIIYILRRIMYTVMLSITQRRDAIEGQQEENRRRVSLFLHHNILREHVTHQSRASFLCGRVVERRSR